MGIPNLEDANNAGTSEGDSTKHKDLPRRNPERVAKKEGIFYGPAKQEISTVKKAARATPLETCESGKQGTISKKKTVRGKRDNQVEEKVPVARKTNDAQKKAIQAAATPESQVTTSSPIEAAIVLRIEGFEENTTKTKIASLICGHGKIEWLEIFYLKDTLGKRAAFVKFKEPSDARKAMSILNGYQVEKKMWNFSVAQNWESQVFRPLSMRPRPTEGLLSLHVL